MRLEINKIEVSKKVDQPYINTILWEIDPNEDPITLDRKQTEYTFYEENNKVYLDMTWRGVYIWNGENELPITEEYCEDNYIKGHLLGIEIEDDAPEGYGIVKL